MRPLDVQCLRAVFNTTPPPAPRRRQSDVSRNEGLLRSKGKGADPGTWANADLSEDEVDLEAQRAALESWKAAQAQSELARKNAVAMARVSVGGHTTTKASEILAKAAARTTKVTTPSMKQNLRLRRTAWDKLTASNGEGYGTC